MVRAASRWRSADLRRRPTRAAAASASATARNIPASCQPGRVSLARAAGRSTCAGAAGIPAPACVAESTDRLSPHGRRGSAGRGRRRDARAAAPGPACCSRRPCSCSRPTPSPRPSWWQDARPPRRSGCSGGALTITLTRNGGAASSIGTSMTIVFTVIRPRGGRLHPAGGQEPAQHRLGGDPRLAARRGRREPRGPDLRAPGLFQGTWSDWIELPDWPVFNLAGLRHRLRRRAGGAARAARASGWTAPGRRGKPA